MLRVTQKPENKAQQKGKMEEINKCKDTRKLR